MVIKRSLNLYRNIVHEEGAGELLSVGVNDIRVPPRAGPGNGTAILPEPDPDTP